MPSASLVSGLWPQLAPIILLACSNVFMTIAWYGHLKFKSVPLFLVILVSWGIAFVEYCFAVPANRIGSAVYSPAELKTIQEVITLAVFAGFTAFYFKEPLSSVQGAGFLLIALGAALFFSGGSKEEEGPISSSETCKKVFVCVLPPPQGRGRDLEASEQIADRKEHISGDRNPESMLREEGNHRE